MSDGAPVTIRLRKQGPSGLSFDMSALRIAFLALLFAAGVGGKVLADPVAPKLMTPEELLALPRAAADFRISYGDQPGQHGDLRVPPGRGPFPVVILIHGGCWRGDFPNSDSLAPMAEALRKVGIASWNVEYRRLGEQGAGWPGTYRDVAAAQDKLRELAVKHRLDLSRVILLGHSAGAHLAHWAVLRPKLPPSSDLFRPNPLPVRGVVNLAGRVDMTDGIEAYDAACFDTVVEKMLGGTPQSQAQHYREASPEANLPLGVRQTLISGQYEDFVPLAKAGAFVAKAGAAGDDARLIVIPGIGHFEPASPYSKAWPVVLQAIEEMLGIRGQPSKSGR